MQKGEKIIGLDQYLKLKEELNLANAKLRTLGIVDEIAPMAEYNNREGTLTTFELEELTSKIIKCVPSIKEPIRLYICESKAYESFESPFGEPMAMLEPEQTGLPPMLDIRFTAKRFSRRPIRLDDIIRTYQMLAPAFLIFDEGANPDLRANKYREIIDGWDFYNPTLAQQPLGYLRFLYNLFIN